MICFSFSSSLSTLLLLNSSFFVGSLTSYSVGGSVSLYPRLGSASLFPVSPFCFEFDLLSRRCSFAKHSVLLIPSASASATSSSQLSMSAFYLLSRMSIESPSYYSHPLSPILNLYRLCSEAAYSRREASRYMQRKFVFRSAGLEDTENLSQNLFSRRASEYCWLWVGLGTRSLRR
ncbi:hypothetical protein BKA65DRAFT_494440 [Rhexocercosporidium sp. MPI-PUGE-AT-0058]|nr:hypothetical protein BKA65DRAFT_494440 [Rhexocercosporidium sp. MPI-PUGE-AT-0058]